MELQTAIEILEYHQEWRLGKREDMIHEPKKLTEALDIVLNEVKKFRLAAVSKSLLIKKYEIDFGGNVLAGLEITNNEPTVIGAMNGWGDGISKDDITITEK